MTVTRLCIRGSRDCRRLWKLLSRSKYGFATAAIAAAVVGVISAPPGFASCGSPGPFPRAIRQAPAAFVGEVSNVSNNRRWAQVDVIEVWSGDDVPATLQVRAGPKDPPGRISSMTTVDRRYRSEQTYLFVPYKRPSKAVFRDSACTRTTRYSADLDRYRPADAVTEQASPTPAPRETVAETEPEQHPHETEGGITPFQWVLSGLFGLGLLGILVGIVRVRRGR